MALVIYGIKNCDTVRKTRKFLDAAAVEYQFHDFRIDGLEESKLRAWVSTLGTDKLVNRRSATWRKLSDEQKSATSDDALIKLMLAQPTLIKRPVIEAEENLHIGHDDEFLSRYI